MSRGRTRHPDLEPMHPGELPREEFIIPLGLSAGKLAKACGVPRSRVERIVAEEVGITADIAMRLGRVLGTTAQFWMNAQVHYDLETAKAEAGDEIEALSPIPRAA